jgi:predicted nuclease of restriction endonuclease-like RecB superfamily
MGLVSLPLVASRAGACSASHASEPAGEIVPSYLGAHDQPWLRALLDEYLRFEGKPRRELDDRLADPLPARAPADKLRLARQALDRQWRFVCRAAIRPPLVRRALFGSAARHADRETAIAAAAAELAVGAEALLDALFADLPYAKLVAAPPSPPSPAQLAELANLELVTSLLRRATRVRIETEGRVRPLVRQAKLRGLLCTVRPRRDRRGRDQLELSGPFALFRRTQLYGRALGSLVPVAAWSERTELRAECVLAVNEPSRVLVVRSGDPLFPAPEPSRYDSKLEARFARDFAALAPDWDVVREPEAISVEGTIIFPDFELRHRRDPARRWLLEIAGFWTPGYLDDKLRRLRRVDRPCFILCIDEERNCSAEDLPARANVVRYRRHVDAAAVLRLLQA